MNRAVKLNQKQLRVLIESVVSESLDPAMNDAFRDALEAIGCHVVGSSSDGTFHFQFPGMPAVATVQLKLFEV